MEMDEREFLKAVTDWCDRQRSALRAQRELFASRTCTTHETRNGMQVDTTDETISRIDRALEEVDRIFEQHRRDR
jgi:hypothetical protein